MDLSNIQDLLDDFSTFAGNIGDFLRIPVQLLNSLLGNDYEAGIDSTSSQLEGLSSAADNGDDADA